MLVVRADASKEIGAGHVMRCLALAGAWRAVDPGAEICFAMRLAPEGIVGRLEREGIHVQRIDREGDLRDLLGRAECVIVDGYAIPHDEQRLVAAMKLVLLVVDDDGTSATTWATWVLNANAYARTDLYAHLAPQPRLLLGTRYALLRREFLGVTRERRPTGARARVLVSFGGADPLDLTPRVVAALVGLEVDVHAVLGAASTRVPAFPSARAHVAVEDMAALMATMDLAVVAAGSTCWELAALGVPMLVVVTAENQRAVARSVEDLAMGATLGEGHHLDDALVRARVEATLADPLLLEAWSTAGRNAVDGRGAERVVRLIRGESQATSGG